MVSCLMSLFVAAALGPAPEEAAWLKSIPADVAVVARVKALEASRDDLMKMLEAMSGNAAALARPQIEQGLAMFEGQYGKHSVQHPFFVVMTLPKGDNPMPGWAVLVEGQDYQRILRDLTKKDLDLKGDDVDNFEGPDGQPWFATKGAGFVAFGPDRALVQGVAKPAATLDEKLRAETKAELLGGELGVYVDLAAIQAQYGEQIEQAKQMFMGLLDQGGGQLDAKTLEGAKALYGTLFDSIKSGDSLALNLNFAAEGLALSGMVTAKGDSEAARALAQAKSGAAEGLARLPGDGFLFSYTNPSPDAALALVRLGSGGNPPAETERAIKLQAEAGALEAYAAVADGTGGLSGLAALGFSTPKDPAKAVEAATLANRGMKTSGQAAFKDVTVTPNAQSYKGFQFNEVTLTFDLEKMTPPNAPGGGEGIKKLLGGETARSWFGTDGKIFLNVGGKTFDEAKARIDAFLSGEGSLGKVPAFAAIRKQLPDDVTGVVLVSAQGLTNVVAQGVTAFTNNPVAVPADMPKETALFGGSITSSPKGSLFRFVVPSNVGPVIEKGLVPVIQSAGNVNQ